MNDLDTEIRGEAANIRAVASWLRQDLRQGFDDLGNEVARQRSAAHGDWQGEAGTAFAGRTQTLVEATDDGSSVTGSTATLVDDLAADLEAAQADMADVRRSARAGDLVVDGFVVRNPGAGPPSAGPSPASGAPADEVAAWQRADQAVRDHNARVAAWSSCVELANEAWRRWVDAIDAASAAWRDNDAMFFGLSGALLSSGVQLELVRRTTPILMADVDHMLTRADELRAHADALRTPDGRVTDPPRFYDLLDEADRLEDAHPGARRALNNWELPRGLTRGLWVVDIAATGYAIHSDWEEEGAAQAITSNAVPAVASIAAGAASGAYIGGVVGSFVPVPGVGTAAGVVVGAAVGTVVGAFTSGAVDSLFQSGADSLGDWGGAVVDGVEEIGETFSDVGDAVGDVFDSIF